MQNYQLTFWLCLESFAPHVEPFIAQIALNHVVLKLVKPFNENVRGPYLLADLNLPIRSKTVSVFGPPVLIS